MSKKHYTAIADLIWPYTNHSDDVIELAHNLADYFEQDNPRFNRDRFLTACGITEK